MSTTSKTPRGGADRETAGASRPPANDEPPAQPAAAFEMAAGLKPGALLDALPIAVYATDATGRITYYNRAAVELWGCSPVLGKSEWCGSWRLFHMDGATLPHEACPMAQALERGEPVRGEPALAERPDGSRVRFLPFPTPLFAPDGALIGAINALVELPAPPFP